MDDPRLIPRVTPHGGTFSFSIKLGRAPQPQRRGPGLEVDVTSPVVLDEAIAVTSFDGRVRDRVVVW